MKFISRQAAESEKLGIDEEAEDLPKGTFAVDFGEYGILCSLDAGDHVIEVEGVSGLDDGEWAVQVLSTEDSAFIANIPNPSL